MNSDIDDVDQNGDGDYEDGIERVYSTSTTRRRVGRAKYRKVGDTLRPDSPLQPLLNLLASFIEGDDHDEDEVSFDSVIQCLLPELFQSRDLAWEKETSVDEHGTALRSLSRIGTNFTLAGLGESYDPGGALTSRTMKSDHHRDLNSIDRYPTSSTFGNTLPKLRVPQSSNSQTLDALYAIQTTPCENSLLSRLHGFQMESAPSLLACDWESRTPWMEVMSDVRAHYMLSHPESDHPFEPNAPINYGSLQPWHLDQIHDLLSRVFWPGINISDSLDYKPERCTVVATYKRLVVGVAIISSPQETYITYLAVKAGWDNAQIATNMLYHLISVNPRRDITLHVSTTNSAMLLYNRFGFKAEGFIAGFYEDYLDPQARSSKNAFRLRLRQ